MTSLPKPSDARGRVNIRQGSFIRSVCRGAVAQQRWRPFLRIAFAVPLLFFALSSRASANEGDDLYRAGHYPEAIDAWRRLAPGGNADAAYRLGVVYSDGVLVPLDYSEAAKWFQLSAKLGDTRAMFDLGSLYDEGNGVAQSDAEALKWYRSAAERGFAPAQFNLGGIYEQGKGVGVDLVEAYKWYTLAAEGMPGFRELVQFEELEKRITNEQKQEAVERAHKFKPSPDPTDPASEPL